MLKEYQKTIASTLAKDLIEDGLLTGEELKEYLILGVNREFLFKSEEHYMEFEECVIDFIEKKRNRIKITDTVTGEIKELPTAKEVASTLGITVYMVSSAIHQKNLVFKRYRLEYQKIPIKDLVKN
ncbi:MAG: hypothetical protein ACRCXT_23005 [Paraclostridium sp.]